MTLSEFNNYLKENITDSDFLIKDNVLIKYIGQGGDVVVPYGVTRIRNNAFLNCNTITSITLPNDIEFIGAKAFAGCDGLADRDGFVIVKYVLHSYCGENADVNVPNGVGYIGNGAFSGKSIVSITIPASVSTIEHQAFISCRKLTKVKILNGNTKISDTAFMWSDKVTIYSPAGGTVEAFANEKGIPFVAE